MTQSVDPAAGRPSTEAALVPADAQPGPIVARSDRRHFLYRCVLMPLLLFALGLYFLYDGYVGWPRQNEQFHALTRQAEQARASGDVKAEADALNRRKDFNLHDEFDLRLQKILGYTLPVLAVAAFVFFYRLQRGQIRLEDDVLYVPGHPPVPLDAVREIDKTKWDRKGIAVLKYELDPPAGDALARPRTGSLTLDDALYDQKRVDEIFDYIQRKLVPAEEAVEA